MTSAFLELLKEYSDNLIDENSNKTVPLTLINNLMDFRIILFIKKSFRHITDIKYYEDVNKILELLKLETDEDRKMLYTLNYIQLTNPILKNKFTCLFKEGE